MPISSEGRYITFEVYLPPSFSEEEDNEDDEVRGTEDGSPINGVTMDNLPFWSTPERSGFVGEDTECNQCEGNNEGELICYLLFLQICLVVYNFHFLS